MLDHLRQHAEEVIRAVIQATLITWGPAELQAAVVRCEARGLLLYTLVSRTSDVLFNLEHRPEVLVVTPQWQLHGTTRMLSPKEYPTGLALLATPEAAWSILVVVMPLRLHRAGDGAADTPETIDLQLSDGAG